jgi:hypothetical protein
VDPSGGGVEERDVPIVATVTATGGVSVLYADGMRLKPARLVK